MAISESRYVSITSGVGGGSAISTRNLVARLFTANVLLPPQSFISFTNSTDVGTYFGLGSEEYLRSIFYFGWLSKSLTQPQSLQFARWVQVAAAPTISPVQAGNTTLAAWNAISSGSFILTMGGFTFTLSGLNFTGAGTLAAVATILQSAIQAESGGGAMWTSATVTYVATSNVGISYGGFELVGGANGVTTNPIIVVAAGGGTDITPKGLLGWLPQSQNLNGNFVAGSIWSTGSAAESITLALSNSSSANNNFGSFGFLTNLGITAQNLIDAATFSNTQNVVYLYSQAVTPANAGTWSGDVFSIGGVTLTLSPAITTSLIGTIVSGANTVTGLTSNAGLSVGMPVTGTSIPANTYITSLVLTTGLTLSNNASGSATESLTFSTLQFPEQVPMMIEASTNYAGLNSVQNYEFQQFPGLTPSVLTDADANTYDALRINYYGVTQAAGQQVAFYQQGLMMGLITNPLDQNVYVNEIWLKDAAGAAIMNLLLAVTQVPANAQGRNQILAILQGVINQALVNGTISVGKTLTPTQQGAITTITGDPTAWYQVQNTGYWVDVEINPTTFTATYTLIYSKDDVIRKVVGTHTLI